MSQAPFVVHPELSAIAMAYRNPAHTLIADKVLPRVRKASEFTYTKYDQSSAYSVPDTRVGRKSAPNQVEFFGTEVTVKVEDYGLDYPVANRDIEVFNSMPKAPNARSPLEVGAMFTSGLLDLAREIRVAQMVFNPAQYAVANKDLLTGAGQFSDPASDPIGYIKAKLDTLLIRPNTLVFGQQAWTAFSIHPDIVQAAKGSAQTAGVASRQAVAELFEVNEILVGGGFYNTAKKGQAPNMQRAWGKHIAMIYKDEMGAEADQPQFGFTGQWGDKISGTIENAKIGLTGGKDVRVGERVKEVIACADLGFFIQNAVA